MLIEQSISLLLPVVNLLEDIPCCALQTEGRTVKSKIFRNLGAAQSKIGFQELRRGAVQGMNRAKALCCQPLEPKENESGDIAAWIAQNKTIQVDRDHLVSAEQHMPRKKISVTHRHRCVNQVLGRFFNLLEQSQRLLRQRRAFLRNLLRSLCASGQQFAWAHDPCHYRRQRVEPR